MLENIAFACGCISIISMIICICSVFLEFNENVGKSSIIIACISWFMMIMLAIYGI